MKTKVLVFLIPLMILVLIIGCDTSRQAAQRQKKANIQTKEQLQQQMANREEVIQQLDQYKEDYGTYPQSLEQLKQAGYDFPEKPSEGWKWAYRVNNANAQPDLMPVRE